LSAIAFITLALAPVALLLYLQITFLPYHSEGITWLHRTILGVDFYFVWILWSGYRSDWDIVSLWRKWHGSWLEQFGALALVYAVYIATFPDEHFYFA
jgi:hypothetical protein